MKILNLGFGILLLAGLAFAADDLDSAFQGLQAAEKSGDTAQIKALAVETCNFAKPIINSPAPEAADAKEEWKQRVEYAQSAQVHAEYALYVAAVKAPPAVGLDLIQTLEQVAPKSKYLDDPAVLLLPASNAFAHGQLDKALTYAKKAIAECGKKPDSNVLPGLPTSRAWSRPRRVNGSLRITICGSPYRLSRATMRRWDRPYSTSVWLTIILAMKSGADPS